MSNIYLSKFSHPLLNDYLMKLGHKICTVNGTSDVYEAISSHADIYMCKLGVDSHSPLIIGDPSTLGSSYPENIKYNAACIGKYFIHNLSYTAPSLIAKAKELNMHLVDLAQGYTKCNMVIVSDAAVITSDAGIAKTLQQCTDIDILLISSGHVTLNGFPYGFLGGASGKVGNKIIFNGNLSIHPDFDKIRSFIESYDLSVKYFPKYPLEDIGSIIEAEGYIYEEARDHTDFYTT